MWKTYFLQQGGVFVQDQYQRNIGYMRISVTDRCNLRCQYCMPHGMQWLEHSQILTYEEIVRLARIAITLGIRRFKLTGGEPLVRHDLVGLVSQLSSLEGCEQVTLTSNGILLAEQAEALAQAGLQAVNISLDTLDRAQYKAITGQDALDKVLESIQASLQAGLKVKINTVLLQENESQLVRLASLAQNQPVDVRFIELMPIGSGAQGRGLSPHKARERLKQHWPDLADVQEKRGNGPAHYQASAGLQGRIGWIEAVSHTFCNECNRIRLTSTGQLKPCLCYEHGMDFRALLRGGASDEELAAQMRQLIFEKPKAHCFEDAGQITEHRQMVQIGG